MIKAGILRIVICSPCKKAMKTERTTWYDLGKNQAEKNRLYPVQIVNREKQAPMVKRIHKKSLLFNGFPKKALH